MFMKIEKEINNKPKGILEIKIKAPFEMLETKKELAVENIVKNEKIDGFRQGKAPKDLVIKKVGLNKVLNEAAQILVQEIFTKILEEEKIQIIGYPAISIEKLEEGKDFEFRIEAAVYPKIELPDYKEIARKVKKKEIKVEDKEVEEVVKNLVNMQNQILKQEGKEEKKELDDEFVSKLGDFKTVKEFKDKLKEDLKKEKEAASISEHRGEIAEAILKEMEFDIPEILINAELDKIIAYIKDDVAKQGGDLKEILKNEGKTEMDLREEHRKNAESRAKFEIVLKEIAKKEKIKLDEKKIEEEKKRLMEIYKDADESNIDLYVRNIFINDEVMKILEKMSK